MGLPPLKDREIPILVEERRRLRQTMADLDVIGREHGLSHVLGPKINDIGQAVDAIEAEITRRFST